MPDRHWQQPRNELELDRVSRIRVPRGLAKLTLQGA